MGEKRSANTMDLRLGARVRARRLEIGMSQERLAELLGITFQQIQKYEKGTNRMAASRLCAIASALETPVAEFFEGLCKTAPSASAAESVLATREGSELVSLFGEIKSRKVRAQAVALVRALARE